MTQLSANSVKVVGLFPWLNRFSLMEEKDMGIPGEYRRKSLIFLIDKVGMQPDQAQRFIENATKSYKDCDYCDGDNNYNYDVYTASHKQTDESRGA